MPIDLAVIHTDSSGCRRVVAIAGEVDLLNAGDLEQRIAATMHGVSVLVLALDGVTYLDSAALHMLERLRRRCGDADVQLTLVCRPGSRARRVLDLSGMTELFAVHDSIESTDGAMH